MSKKKSKNPFAEMMMKQKEMTAMMGKKAPKKKAKKKAY